MDKKTTVLFLHGLESGPHGSKYHALRAAGWAVEAPDAQGEMDVGKRVDQALEALRALEGPVTLFGSSFGGLVAALVWEKAQGTPLAEKIEGMVLAAPAFHRPEATFTRLHPATKILHGTEDTVVPLEASREAARRFGAELHEVEDGHRLEASTAAWLALLA